MAIFAVLHVGAFTYKDYVPDDKSKTTRRWKLVVDAFNFFDFIREFWKACKWLFVGRKLPETNDFEFVEDDGMINFLKASYRSKYGVEGGEPASLPVRESPANGNKADSTFVFPWAITVDNASDIDLSDLSNLADPSEPKMRVLLTRSRSNSTRNASAGPRSPKSGSNTPSPDEVAFGVALGVPAGK